MAKPHILIADDDSDLREAIRDWLASEPWFVQTAGDGREAFNLLCNSHFDIAVLDFKMPGLNGIDVLQAIRREGIQTDVLILTGYGTIETAVQAIKKGAEDFLQKPFKKGDLIAIIQRLLERRNLLTHALPDRLDAFLNVRAFDPSLKLEDLCRHFKISARYVSKLFKERIGMSFRRRLAHFRVERAKTLLESTDEPLYRIAEKCGFRDYRQLTMTFRRLEKIPPREYRVLSRDRKDG